MRVMPAASGANVPAERVARPTVRTRKKAPMNSTASFRSIRMYGTPAVVVVVSTPHPAGRNGGAAGVGTTTVDRHRVGGAGQKARCTTDERRCGTYEAVLAASTAVRAGTAGPRYRS